MVGIEYIFILNNESGYCVLDVKFELFNGDKVDLNIDDIYCVVINNFVGVGGDGYFVFMEVFYGEDFGYVDYEIFIE